MTNEYELADDTRESLIYEKEDLLAPLLPGMAPPPHPMVEGTDAGLLLRRRSPRPPGADSAYARPDADARRTPACHARDATARQASP